MVRAAAVGEKGALAALCPPAPKPSLSRAWWQGLIVLRPAGYLVLRADEASWLRVPSLPPQGRAEEVPVILLWPQEALLLFLVKLGTR